MATQKLETQIRQKQISEAALDLMGTCGVDALSIAALARQVGLVPSGIYRHFKSKNDVLDATLDLIGEKLFENVKLVQKKTSDSAEQLRMLLKLHIKLISVNRAIPHIVFSESIYSGSSYRKNSVRNIITGYIGEIEKIVLKGQKSGSLRKEVDPKTTALMFMGIILPAVIVWKLTDGAFDLVRHSEDAWLLFKTAILTDQ